MSERFDELCAILDRLRGEGGCPWDREQTLESVVECMRGELDEVEEAARDGDPADLCEELGDLLFTIVFAIQIGRERDWFTADDVLRGICEKLVRRHPHVFGERRDLTTQEVLDQWERIKRDEKRSREG